MAALHRGGLAMAGTDSRVAADCRAAAGRILRALRLRGQADDPGLARLAMVTSARPGEGKSFSALNIAASLARDGVAGVLLVDVAAAPQSLAARLGLHDQPGLRDLMAAPAQPPEELVVPTAIAGLSVLPPGRHRPDLADAGTARALAGALARLRRCCGQHVLLLDGAACLSSGDPAALAPLVDQVIMVVEAARTRRGELYQALDLVRACPGVILVLNKMRLTQRRPFGSPDHFGDAS
jgi:receptor protein-tyrosine kinase